MARYDQQVEQQLKNDLRVEFGQELGIGQALDPEYERGALSIKEYGTMTKRLLEVGAKVFKSDSSKDK